MLIILRLSTKHANFGAFWGRRCSTPLIKNQTFQEAELEVEELQAGLKKIEDLSKEVAEYFLEDVATFNLQEYLGIFARFAEQVKQAYEVSLSLSKG